MSVSMIDSPVANPTTAAGRLAAEKRRKAAEKSPAPARRKKRSGLVECRLRVARKMHGLSLADVARAVGVTPVMMMNYESGSSAPSVTKALKIAAFYGVPVSDLWPVNQGA